MHTPWDIHPIGAYRQRFKVTSVRKLSKALKVYRWLLEMVPVGKKQQMPGTEDWTVKDEAWSKCEETMLASTSFLKKKKNMAPLDDTDGPSWVPHWWNHS